LFVFVERIFRHVTRDFSVLDFWQKILTKSYLEVGIGISLTRASEP